MPNRLGHPHNTVSHQLLRFYAFCPLLLVLAHANNARAQDVPPIQRGSATITVRTRTPSDTGALLPFVTLRSNATNARTDIRGMASLQLPPGSHSIIATRLGYRADSATVSIRAGVDTTVALYLEALPAEGEAILVSATRSERRVEDTPLRVEVIDEEEVAEKVTMSPGDIAMMLNETSGLRVQSTNPSIGGANVRIQGLRGRYTLLLTDGLPLYGAQSGGLGLLQIPPVDLARVEVIKGAASALYGSSALGGVIDLLSKRPGKEREQAALLNVTSRNGRDVVYFGSTPAQRGSGFTLLAGMHTQRANDIDNDRYTDMPGYTRYVARPRFFHDNNAGRTVHLTAGFTAEDRKGGTIGVPPTDVFSNFESLQTRRLDAGAVVRWLIPQASAMLPGAIFTLRASGVQQKHRHVIAYRFERDRHRTLFSEASLTVPRGAITYVAGAAFQNESYAATDVPSFNYSYAIPALFAQVDAEVRPWFVTSASVRADMHSEYGTFVNPRLSVLMRPTASGRWSEWNARVSVGTGAFAPTPLVEETEVTGLTPLNPIAGVVAERAISTSADVGGPIATPFGRLELNTTVFASRLSHALQVVDASRASNRYPPPISLQNSSQPTRSSGAEFLARLIHTLGDNDEAAVVRLTSTYTFLRSTECTGIVQPPASSLPSPCNRNGVALTPRHSASMVGTIEQEGKSRMGVELYYTGRQRLADNPYRAISKPYLIVGLMAERAFEFGKRTLRPFVNFENLTDVRQTKYDPLVLPVGTYGSGGRVTTDAWTDLNGFTVNGGVRFVW